MVQNRTVLKVIDNSGAKYVRCLKVLNKKKSRIFRRFNYCFSFKST